MDPKFPASDAPLSRASNQNLVSKRSKKSLRPATAPAKEDIVLLPSFQSGSKLDQLDTRTKPSGSLEPIRTDDSSKFPPVSDASSAQGSASSGNTETRNQSADTDYDWSAFISAYGAGKWDPHKTPNPPIFTNTSPGYAPVSDFATTRMERSSSMGDEVTSGVDFSSSQKTDIFNVSPQADHSPAPGSSSISRSAAPTNLNLPSLPTHRIRNSISSTTPSSSKVSPTLSPINNSDMQTAAAAIRWAGARVNVSPLALPSPEHELTDPMRGYTATIPRSHQPVNHAQDPSQSRKRRLTSFWRGTQDVDGQTGDPVRLPTIEASPSPSPLSTPPIPGTLPPDSDPESVSRPGIRTSETQSSSQSSGTSNIGASISPYPATAPVHIHSNEDKDGPTDPLNSDYFGNIDVVEPSQPSTTSSTESPSRPSVTSTSTAMTSPPSGVGLGITDPRPGSLIRAATSPLEEASMGTLSVPAMPRRVILTRQTSSPLPLASNSQELYPGGRLASEGIQSVKAIRSAKEEQMYMDLGFLAPPNPPDELERRRAMYKFNIWNTGPDQNFDRIAHLAKLVFNTKGVVISLIDANEQWHKSESGVNECSLDRTYSFDAHSILQRGDEPMIVLDAPQDWRFAKNPQVTGPLKIRFYAGAPLRTQDGFNIGCLAVYDDSPRDDFNPRQRHTLKEFAAVAMREMELWRDKIQLRIRDRIQNSMEEFSRECLEIDSDTHQPERVVARSMDKVYDRAAKLVRKTLDVEGVVIMDVSKSDIVETMGAEANVSVVLHHGDPQRETYTRLLTPGEFQELSDFFSKFPDGKISEGIIPSCFRPFLPTHIQHALSVPIFNIDKRPFALLCAYNSPEHEKRYLEGHELSYLRAIGVIILSAVLKRRMILADKAKSLFISNISHELRTPLHGILAAAELLKDTTLTSSQMSFLQTVYACGTSLVETVNHVLDFTKLSGNSKSGGVENVISPSLVDLKQLVEEAVDGCWIGHHARQTIYNTESGIGSVYSPPKDDKKSSPLNRKYVEPVLDVSLRQSGWLLRCEKGGIRRVLMNVFGNSLKFTTDGYVHVTLRQLPYHLDDPPESVRIELTVIDTGKGINQSFLQNQLFHPFSQENPLQTGTGLGLAIVNSIIKSNSVGGTVDVSSQEGVGTEVKITFTAMGPSLDSAPMPESEKFTWPEPDHPPTVLLVGFDIPHKGTQLLLSVLSTYLENWWGFVVTTSADQTGDIIILNDLVQPVVDTMDRHDSSKPYVVLSATRGDHHFMRIASEYEIMGGFCRIVHKPIGPTALRNTLALAMHAVKIASRAATPGGSDVLSSRESGSPGVHQAAPMIVRRSSDEGAISALKRPPMSPRASTVQPTFHASSWLSMLRQSKSDEEKLDPESNIPAITVGSGGSLLKSSVNTVQATEQSFKILVIEDNDILRNLLLKWLKSKGYASHYAAHGRDGVDVYEKEGPFSVVLLDLSMPVLDGFGTTEEIRKIEEKRRKGGTGAPDPPARILALTGMSSLEDKSKAFSAGVDGYLVKPVSFKTLDEVFFKLGIRTT